MSVAKDRFLENNTLACVIELCVGHVTTVELRNESHVTGRVTHVDGFMNVTMREVEFCDPSGRRKKFEHFFVPNRLVRYTQIPAQIDIKAALQKRFGGPAKSKMTSAQNISGGRKKILAMREKRRQEDLANALAMKAEASKKE